ncbi:hypothetical protein JOC77_002875 [Peribacillus deserti]|uniref:YpzI family protein n=1 Tax=Peribacillus deserti TaxID=673318 RepID=A0ABS2QKA6_9BACI|nr:hypothetical protein [Peribacillus deserti]MBM7693435.1 hypothetical protein [Peribacillus deserti]
MDKNQGGKNRMQDGKYQTGDKRKIDTLADATGPASTTRNFNNEK